MQGYHIFEFISNEPNQKLLSILINWFLINILSDNNCLKRIKIKKIPNWDPNMWLPVKQLSMENNINFLSNQNLLNTVFRLLTDFVCLYNYEFWLSLCKIARSSVILLLPLFITVIYINILTIYVLFCVY
jgi:prepilin signal peptidase PulO-like enzyme (type II secretory pathway)